MTSGIYCIENLINNKKYIGKGKSVEIRWSSHKSQLRSDKHKNKYLQNSWNKYGEDNFKFYIIKECSKEELIDNEIYYIKELKTKVPNGYNKTDGGEGLSGYKFSKDHKNKLSKSNKGKKRTPEQNKRNSDSHKGQIGWAKGKVFSESYRKKISENHADVSGKKNPFYGKTHSEESLFKMTSWQIGTKKKDATSLFLGVCFKRKKWESYFRYKKEVIYLGRFEDETDAAQAYDLCALEKIGLNAKINFPNKIQDYLEYLNS